MRQMEMDICFGSALFSPSVHLRHRPEFLRLVAWDRSQWPADYFGMVGFPGFSLAVDTWAVPATARMCHGRIPSSLEPMRTRTRTFLGLAVVCGTDGGTDCTDYPTWVLLGLPPRLSDCLFWACLSGQIQTRARASLDRPSPVLNVGNVPDSVLVNVNTSHTTTHIPHHTQQHTSHITKHLALCVLPSAKW